MLFRCLVFLVIVTWCSAAGNRPPPCHLMEVDLCISHIIGFTDKRAGAQSESLQHERQCNSIKRLDNCVSNYTRHCMTPIQQQLSNLGLGGIRRVEQEYCPPNSELRQTYLKHVPCLRSVIKAPDSPCTKDLNLVSEVVTEAKWNKRVNYACCGYHRIGACLRREVTRACGPETMEFVRTMAKKLLSRLPEIRCRDLKEDSPVCQELPPFGSSPKSGRSTSVINKLIRTYTTS